MEEALFNRTSDPSHIKRVQENVKSLYSAGLFEQRTMEQYYEVRENGTGRFLPDRYVEGNCPTCNAEGARVINAILVVLHMRLQN